MNTIQFLAYLRSLDVQLAVEGEHLRCHAPEGTFTPQLKAELAHHKPALITLLRSTDPLRSPEIPLVAIRRDRPLPLSFAQQRLWFLNQLVPENPFYNMPAAIRLQGHLDRMALLQAFNTIVERHETLRTSFVSLAGQPTQMITPHLSLELPVVDVRGCDPEAIRRLLQEEADRPFNLATGPLLRIKLLQQETDYLLLLTLHHIVSDGWSMGVLLQELGAIYTATIEGKPSPLPPLLIQYADFADWQRHSLQGAPLELHLSYWRQQLKDLPMLNLPSDRPRAAVANYKGAILPIQLSAELSSALETFSQAEGVTLFMTLLTAFQILLYRYTHQEDIVVGSPIANRNHSQIEKLIGFFVNSLVLRVDLSGNPTFRELLARVREVALAAYAHQDLPFEKLVEELHPERDLSRNPLFQVVFALQNAPVEQLQLPKLTLEAWQIDLTTTRFDLEFHLWERVPDPATEPRSREGLSGLWKQSREGIGGFVAYSTELFDAATIERMIGHFQTLLTELVVHPDQQIAHFPILKEAERNQLLRTWNQTAVFYDRDSCIHQVFAAQAAHTPNAVAVVFEDQQLTYQELDQRSNQLADYLQQRGVTTETLVGICLDRSQTHLFCGALETIVAVLAVWKAGAAYVPIDPDYPVDRRNFLLTDAQVAMVLTQKALVNSLPERSNVIFLDQDAAAIRACDRAFSTSSTTADNLAYVIYTSGSTGTPKGVLVQHRGLCNVVAAQIQTFRLQPGSRILQFSSLSFDASVFEMLLAFGVAGTLYIAPQAARLSGEVLHQFLKQQEITAAILPPAVLSSLPETELSMQTLISGGEACHAELVDRWASDRQFFNAYGPTETTIWATVAHLQPGAKPTIGRPVANTQIYLLDAYLQPVPIGVTGEIYIGGVGVARGYLNRPELTHERFIPNPFTHPSETQSNRQPLTANRFLPRLYKTGDLARYLPDGNLEFLGRVDDQVKLRGFRIELGEIEARLKQQPMVKEAVVLLHAGLGDQLQIPERLVAYVSLNIKELSLSQQKEQIKHWQTLYNQTYGTLESHLDPTFAITGWNSSYTREPIAAKEMREWLDYRAQQILDYQPQRVLEIGCGTGLMLFQIAPHCTEYWGTDFSQAAISALQPQIDQRGLHQVTLLHQQADDFTHLNAIGVDAVILNSVVQYFPSLDYLIRVLESAIQTVVAGGFIFIGDVRSLPLLPAFHAAVQLQADPTLDRSQLRQRVQQAIFEETELVIDPEFFHALRQRLPQIGAVQIQLTRGRHANEMTQFRYNVILHIEAEPILDQTHSKHLVWTEQQTPQTIQQYLLASGLDTLTIANVPNARVMAATTTAAWLAGNEASRPNQPQTVETLSHSGIDPEDWWQLESQIPYQIEIRWSVSEQNSSEAKSVKPFQNWTAEGRYDVVFHRQPVAPTLQRFPSGAQRYASARPWQDYANNPLQAQVARQLIPQLRQFLEQTLPAYMVPAAFVVLESLPLMPNGKVDRRALPAPDIMRPEVGGDAPRSHIETKLVNLWAALLGLKRVGIHDNFFELGGHSLLATQLTSRIRDAFGVELPLRNLFEAPTIAQLAQRIETLKTHSVQSTPTIVPLARDAHRRLRSTLTNPQEQ